MLELALVGALIYLVYSAGALAPFGIVPPARAGSLASTVTPGGLQSNVSLTAPPVGLPSGTSGFSAYQAESIGIGAGAAVLAAPSTLMAFGVAAQAVPVVGTIIGAVAAITAALLAAHEQRKKQATDENSAMNLGVAGYDKGMRMINAAYNNRSIDTPSAIQLLQTIMPMYWQEVNAHIQPGRNGCYGGANCPAWHGCNGDIGAACCVGCYDLVGQPDPHVFSAAEGGDGVTPLFFGATGTILALQHGGGFRVLYQHVYGSKYGGKDRPAYTLDWVQAGT